MTKALESTLIHLKKGEVAEVLELFGPAQVVARLQELGAIRGAMVTVVEILTFGEPIIADFDEVRLALRKSEAACVRIQTNPVGASS